MYTKKTKYNRELSFLLINPWIWGTLVMSHPISSLPIYIYYVHSILHNGRTSIMKTTKRNKANTLWTCSEANGIAAKSGIRAPNQPFQTPASSVIHSPSGSKTVRTFRESIKHHDNAHMEINGWLVHKNEQVIHCFPFVHDFSLRMGDYVQFPLPVLDS